MKRTALASAAIALTVLALTGCSSVSSCLRSAPAAGSGVHIGSVEPDGSVCFRPLQLGSTPRFSSDNGSLSTMYRPRTFND